ncbi:MAG: hypothetical protein F6K30_12930 [Cyanothece sp. SIO2G6]|nr:hypothetical protein [Cyanothece sp. SIO2G6]
MSTLSFNQDNFEERVQVFEVVSSYFSGLLTDGDISDKQYKALVQYAALVLLNQEIEELVASSIEEYVVEFIEHDIHDQIGDYLATEEGGGLSIAGVRNLAQM